MSSIYRFFTEHLGGQNSASFISRTGDAWFDPAINEIRISDGTTPGGLPLTATNFVVKNLIASNNITVGTSSSDNYTFDDISFATDGRKNTFALKYNQQTVSFSNPYNLDVSINGLVQTPFIPYTTSLMWQSMILSATKGFTVDTSNNIKFSSSVPSGSNVLIRTRFGNTSSVKNIYPFRPLDIVMG
jgi:hypothetical protein